MSKQPFSPTQKQRELVEALAGLMVQQETIARLLEIDAKTLRKYFRAELDHGQAQTGAKLKAIIYAAARNGSVRAACYLLDKTNAWPVQENAAAPQQVQVIVRGGIAAIQEPDAPAA